LQDIKKQQPEAFIKSTFSLKSNGSNQKPVRAYHAKNSTKVDYQNGRLWVSYCCVIHLFCSDDSTERSASISGNITSVGTKIFLRNFGTNQTTRCKHQLEFNGHENIRYNVFTNCVFNTYYALTVTNVEMLCQKMISHMPS
jgi:hypothetical protein